MRRNVQLAALIGLIASAGCLALPWSTDQRGDDLPAAASDEHGLLFVFGSDDIQTASARLSTLIPDSWESGVNLSGASAGPMLDALPLTITWDALLASVGPARISVQGSDLVATIGLRIRPSGMTVGDGFSALCEPIVALDGSELHIPMGLGADKFGRVQASALDTPFLSGDLLDVDWSDCGAEVQALGLDTVSDGVLGDLALNAADTLGPDLLAAIPGALGLDVAVGFSETVSADRIGSGVAKVSIEAQDDLGADLWSIVAGQLVVPMSVAIVATHHPCMPDADLPQIATTPVPELAPDSQASLLVSTGVLERAMATAVSTGTVCADHAMGETVLLAADLASGWPSLERLPADARLTLQVWPRGLPQLLFRDGQPGEVVVNTGLVDVDIYGEIDGASVRLTSLTLDAEATGELIVTSTGVLKFAPDDLKVVASGTTGGLLPEPGPALGQTIAVPLLRSLIVDRPLAQLPPMPPPQNSTRRVAIRDGFVAIGD